VPLPEMAVRILNARRAVALIGFRGGDL
jgi:hypothetical protein